MENKNGLVKLLVVILVLGLALSLCGCAKIASEQPEKETETEEIAEPSLTPSPTPSPTPEPERVLTITEVGIDMNAGLSSVTATDESGKEVELSANLADWFYDASVKEIYMPEGCTMNITGDGMFLADDGSELDVTMNIGGSEQRFALKVGSQFKYETDESGNIKVILSDSNIASAPAEIEHKLTVETVMLEDMSTVGEVTATDDMGKEIILPSDWTTWFDNATIENIELLDMKGGAGGIHMDMTSGTTEYSLADGSHFKITATIDGTQYTFDIGAGSIFTYRTADDGSVKLVIDSAFTPVE